MGTISGQVSYSGLSTGQDFKAIVDQLVGLEERTIVRQEVWKDQWQEKLTSINELDGRLVSLKLNAQEYDTYDELLAREAKSSNEEVVTISNTSTAPPGVYVVDVGENIQEKISSKPTSVEDTVGTKFLRNEAGKAVDGNGKIIGAATAGDPGVIAAVGKALDTDEEIVYDEEKGVYYKKDQPTEVLAKVVTDVGLTGLSVGYKIITGDIVGAVIAVLGAAADALWSLPDDEVDPDGDGPLPPELQENQVIATGDDTKMVGEPLTITMGGKTLTVKHDAEAVYDPDKTSTYNEDMTIEQMNQVINNAMAKAQVQWEAYVKADPKPEIPPQEPPNIRVDLQDAQGKDDIAAKRLIITGLDGGQKNHITISDPTNLRLNSNSVGAVRETSWVGSQVVANVTDDSEYTGNVNKTITVAATSNTGTMGVDSIAFSWADTEGNGGTFTVKPEDWDATANKLKEPIDLLQGVKIDFAGGGSNNVVKSEAFSIDCHAPVMQKASDSGLAQTDKWVHQGVADLTTAMSTGNGVLAIKYGGKQHDFKFSGDVSISNMAEKINTDPKNPGIFASVLNDGMGTANSYKLVLSGAKSGAEYGIEVLDSTKISNMDTSPKAWTHAREASNSMCRIDGYPSDGESWIQRQVNEVGDAIDGVVLSLQGTGSSTISVRNNVTEMVTRITQLVESVNFCKQFIKEQTKYAKGSKLVSKWNEESKMFQRVSEGGSDKSGVMIGNYGFQIAQSNIDRLMTKQIFTRDEFIKVIDPDGKGEASRLPDITPEGEDTPSKQSLYNEYLDQNGLIYSRLSDIGISSDAGDEKMGLYTIEKSKLTEALNKNPEAVLKLFTFDPGEGIPPSQGAITEHKPLDDEEPRPRIGGFNVMMGYAMSDLTRTTDVIDSQTGDVVEAAKGITRVLSENYTNIMQGIDVKIAREEIRIGMMRSRLEEKFTRLEVSLAKMQEQSSKTQSMVDQASNNKK